MSLKDKLQIILITYNREKLAERTLSRLFAADSPVKDFDITVLDNNSTDNTFPVVQSYQKKYANLKYVKNNYNIGLAGNIFRAVELAQKEYHWILADDDEYFWQNWSYLEAAVKEGHNIICGARYLVPNGQENNLALILCQVTFIPALIFKKSILNDTVMYNVINTVYTLFPHLPIAIAEINNGGGIYVLPQPVVTNNMQDGTDVSYVRGYSREDIYERQKSMSWMSGFVNIIHLIKDKRLKQNLVDSAVQIIHGSYHNFYKHMVACYSSPKTWMHLFDVIYVLRFSKRIKLLMRLAVCNVFNVYNIIYFYSTDKGVNVCLFRVMKTRIIPAKVANKIWKPKTNSK